MNDSANIEDMFNDMPDNKVFDWLGTDTKKTQYYLRLLNLMWSENGFEHDIKIYCRVALMLKDEPQYLKEIIRTPYWRHTLVGCITVILLNSRDYFSDLAFRFTNESWITPQIAVTLGLIHTNESIDVFRKVLDSATPKSYEKTIISAQCALEKLGSKRANEFTHTPVWNSLKNGQDAQIAFSVFNNHWEFWKDKIGKAIS